ncbi:response regulator [Shewanella sp. 125m-1]
MSEKKKHILYVEDDLKLASLVTKFLINHHFDVTQISSCVSAINEVFYGQYDLLLLDVGLPDGDGFEICRQVRHDYHGPILLMTARASQLDQINGFNLGADDYMVKPVAPSILLARVNARLRDKSDKISSGTRLHFGRLLIDRVNMQVFLAGNLLPLTTSEYYLLNQLASHAGSIVSRDSLFKSIVGRKYDGMNRTIDGRISRLRKKVGDDVQAPTKIKTIWGQGYLFAPEEWQQ